MRIHTDNILSGDMYAAAREAGVRVESCALTGSRSRDHAFTVYLSGSSTRNSHGRTHKAATWDEWGVFIAALYRIDPGAMFGSARWGYMDADDFHMKTCDRFQNGMPWDTHPQHRFRYDYTRAEPWSGVRATECTGCSARTYGM